MSLVLGSLCLPYVKGQSTNSTTSSFTAAMGLPTITKPAPSATRTVIATADSQRSKDMVTLKVLPFGGDTDNDIINLKVIGWNSVQSQTGLPSVLYISRSICELAATLSSTLLGIANMPMVATEFLADTLSLTTGFAVIHQGTANIDPAWFECDVSSYEFVEVLYSRGTGGDRANCFYSF